VPGGPAVGLNYDMGRGRTLVDDICLLALSQPDVRIMLNLWIAEVTSEFPQ